MQRFLSFTLLFSLIFFLFPSKVFAANGFKSAYDVTYTVLENGMANANFRVDLTNTQSNSYAYSYKLALGFDNIQNVKASDPEGIIIPVVEKVADGYTIDLTFNKHVVGVNNTLRFNLSFDTTDIVQRQGKIWEVNIPGVPNSDNSPDFNVHVKVPSFLGRPTYIKPEQVTKSLDFTKEQLGKSGISIAFGEKQIYEFSLSYHLKNPNLFPVKTEIALPPTTNYQDVVIDSINSIPSNVTLDKDGNWLAQYILKPSEKKDVIVKGKVQISLYPKKEPLSEKELKEYLKEQPFWQVSNGRIKELAKKLKTPQAIYQYVVDFLTYDFSRVTSNKSRVGALSLLDNPTSAVCLEFTDLFVAIARAAGIPAREIDGFAYTENSKQRPLSLVKDVLHAWPQYYDKEQETWVMIDPTWGNTTKGVDYFNTFDFDHFAFTIKGKDSNYPIPAGGYKLPENINTKDVFVDFAKTFEEPISSLEMEQNISDLIISGLPITGYINIKNTGKVLLPKENVLIESDILFPKSQQIVVDNLPPYGSIKLPVSFYKTSIDFNKKAAIKITLHGNSITKEVKITPFYLTKWGIGGGVLIGIFTISIFIIAQRARSIFIPRQRK